MSINEIFVQLKMLSFWRIAVYKAIYPSGGTMADAVAAIEQVSVDSVLKLIRCIKQLKLQQKKNINWTSKENFIHKIKFVDKIRDECLIFTIISRLNHKGRIKFEVWLSDFAGCPRWSRYHITLYWTKWTNKRYIDISQHLWYYLIICKKSRGFSGASCRE